MDGILKLEPSVLPEWDLSVFYDNPKDPRIMEDVDYVEISLKMFEQLYRGKLQFKISEALKKYVHLSVKSEAIYNYLNLLISKDSNDDDAKSKMSEVQKRLDEAFAEHMTFFREETSSLSEKLIEDLAKDDEFLRKNLLWFVRLRESKKRRLDEKVQSAISKRARFGAASWKEFFKSELSNLRFVVDGRTLSLSRMLDVVSNNADSDIREDALKIVNDGLGENFVNLSTQTLNIVIASKSVEDKDRGYSHPMDFRNERNMLDASTVLALHESVGDVGSFLGRRYYRLKAKMLGKEKLLWSDRSAFLPFDSSDKISFGEAKELVLSAYENFSPEMADIVRSIFNSNRIDAVCRPQKRTGAFNLSTFLPNMEPASFTFLSFGGSGRSVMTLAHELGHGVHGILSAREHGYLLYRPPIALCETASIAGEAIAFEAFKNRTKESGNKHETLSVVCARIEDILNSVVRQISFSNFEMKVHNAGRRLSSKEIDAIWIETTENMYGKTGDVFVYKDMEHLWSYIHHFHRPFYVYGYAFGELLVQSMFAVKDQFGKDFQRMFVNFLKAGGTKRVDELLMPFGLDISSRSFWDNGLLVGLGQLIDQAEFLWNQLNKENNAPKRGV